MTHVGSELMLPDTSTRIKCEKSCRKVSSKSIIMTEIEFTKKTYFLVVFGGLRTACSRTSFELESASHPTSIAKMECPKFASGSGSIFSEG